MNPSQGYCPFKRCRYQAGVILFSAGQPAKYIWLVQEGLVGLIAVPGLFAPDESVSTLYQAGDTIGVSYVREGNFTASARTLATTVLCASTRTTYHFWHPCNNDTQHTASEACLCCPRTVKLSRSFSRTGADTRRARDSCK